MRIPAKRFIQTIGIIHLLGSIIAFLAGITLLFPGTPLDPIWIVNPIAYQELLPFAKAAGVGFLFLSPLLAVAGYGLFHFKRWGWTMAVLIIGTNAVGDLANLWRGEALKGMIGMVIALTLLLYLLSSPVKKCFVQQER